MKKPAAVCAVLLLVVLLILFGYHMLQWRQSGSRYVSWLPSFSVEVTRVRLDPPNAAHLDHMARQVQQMFPQFPLAALTRDLATTRSPDLTVDNILEGRLRAPAHEHTHTNHYTAAMHTAQEIPSNQPEVASTSTSTGGESGASTGGDTTTSTSTGTSTSTSTAATSAQSDSGGFAHFVSDHHSEESSAAAPIVARFSRSVAERQALLQHRKQQLVAGARARYLQRGGSAGGSSGGSTGGPLS